MDYVSLGLSTERVSRIGFGCGPMSGYDYGPVDQHAIEISIELAIDAGINLFDVADVYGFGEAEEALSRVLGKRRHDVLIATKGGVVWDDRGRRSRDCKPETLWRALDSSLARLKVECISLYQVHWPDGVTPLSEIMMFGTEARSRGKIRCFGLSNFSLDELLTGESEVVDALQVPYSLLCREAELGMIDWCRKRSVSMLAHSPLARGLLTGKYSVDAYLSFSDTRNRSMYFAADSDGSKDRLLAGLRRISEQKGIPVSAVAAGWILANPVMSAILVGIKQPRQLYEILMCISNPLTDEEVGVLSDLSARCEGVWPGHLARSVPEAGVNTNASG